MTTYELTLRDSQGNILLTSTFQTDDPIVAPDATGYQTTLSGGLTLTFTRIE